MRKNDEAETVAALNKGCEVAFKVVFERTYKDVCRFIAFRVRDQHLAEDFASDIFIELWQRHKYFSSFNKIRAFLFVCARNRVRDYFKSGRNKLCPVDPASLSFMIEENAEHDQVTADLLNLVRANMHCLSIQRAKIVDMVFKGMNDVDISIKMGISKKTVRNQRMNAVHFFRNILPGKLNKF